MLRPTRSNRTDEGIDVNQKCGKIFGAEDLYDERVCEVVTPNERKLQRSRLIERRKLGVRYAADCGQHHRLVRPWSSLSSLTSGSRSESLYSARQRTELG